MVIRRHIGLHPNVCPDGSCRVRMRLSMPKQGRVTWWLSSKVDARLWDGEACRFSGSSQDAKNANAEISEIVALVDEVFGRYELIEKRVPSIAEVKEEVDAALGRTIIGCQYQQPVQNVLSRFVEEQGTRNNWTSATYAKFSALKRHLAEFCSTLTFDEVTDERLQDFYEYMLNVLGFKNTTVAKQLAFVRWFLRWAANNGYYTGLSHNTFHPRIKGVTPESREIIYCTRDEVLQLIAYNPDASHAYLGKVRDVFVFCCFTGLRFSDVYKLRRCDVSDGYISVVTQKTSDALRIELNNHSAEILQKYYNQDADPSSSALPVMCNARMNICLKELGKLAGLNAMTRIIQYHGSKRIEEYKPKYELLTTHCARRTFVVMALQLGIAPEVIMRWTGHSSYEAMKPYVAIVDELKRRSMDKFNFI